MAGREKKLSCTVRAAPAPVTDRHPLRMPVQLSDCTWDQQDGETAIENKRGGKCTKGRETVTCAGDEGVAEDSSMAAPRAVPPVQ